MPKYGDKPEFKLGEPDLHTTRTMQVAVAAKLFSDEVMATNNWEETCNSLENFFEYLEERLEEAKEQYENWKED
jgi:hypothetical protein